MCYYAVTINTVHSACETKQARPSCDVYHLLALQRNVTMQMRAGTLTHKMTAMNAVNRAIVIKAVYLVPRDKV